jgi:hypothetical protein
LSIAFVEEAAVLGMSCEAGLVVFGLTSLFAPVTLIAGAPVSEKRT